ncbi:MAG: Tartronate-semialdehyde synthase [Solirubrobacterales bacterium]|nr:Tartronate-semialdehyde synthase [Solirubrobacterales bacterium]
MTPMPAMEAVVKVLESEGVDTIFGIPGASILPFYDALRGSSIRHLTVRHEEGGTHAAEGYSRATGRIGVAVGTSGPAGTNMVTGLYTAWADSVPILTITGQVPLAQLDREGFQAVDIAEIVKPVVKKSYLVSQPDQLPWVFREAFRTMREGRPGPVHIDLPVDVQLATIAYDAAADGPLAIHRAEPHPAAIERALDLLLAAERPLLMPGGGVILADACEELVELAELLQLPVVPTLMGWGSIPNDHPLYVGLAGIQTQTRAGNKALLESDLVLAVGARFADRHTGDLDVYRAGRRFIHIDVEPTQIGRVFGPDLGIVADARLALKALVEAARRRLGTGRAPTLWSADVPDRRTSLARKTDYDTVPIKPQRVFQELNEFFDRDTVFVTAIGLYQIWSGQFQEVYQPRHYLICGQAGPLGWEIPACIGAKLGRPDKAVVGVVGDFSFQFLMEEVAVACQYEVPFVLVMLNNAYLGLIRQAELKYDMNYGVDIGYDESYGIDHVKVMEGMGAAGRVVDQPEDIRAALEWAVATAAQTRRPVLVEVLIEREANAAMGAALDAIKEFESADREPAAATIEA